MLSPSQVEQNSPFIPVGDRIFTPGDVLRSDPVRVEFIGQVLTIRAMTSDGLVFVDDPNNPNGQIAFSHTQGEVQPPLTWLENAC